MSIEVGKNGEESWLEVGRLAELGLLSSILVHEIRQPLFAIKALLQVHAPDPDDARRAECHALVMAQILQMERLLEAHGGLVQRPGSWREPFLPAQPLEAAFGALSVRARQLGVAMDLDAGGDLPILRGNAVAMQQVVVNLLQNALDAVTGLPAGRIRLEARGVPEGLEITVSDNGQGIPAEDTDRIFEPYYTTKPPGRGTGLGLAIARHLVDLAGGSIRVESMAGRTVIQVFYPQVAPGS